MVEGEKIEGLIGLKKTRVCENRIRVLSSHAFCELSNREVEKKTPP